MAGAQPGRNAGITGLFDLPNLGAKFEGRLYRWTGRQEGTQRQRRGRGSGFYRSIRWLMSSGNIAASGKGRLDGWPQPDQFRGETGTLTIKVDATRSIEYPVRVTMMELHQDEAKNDLPNYSLTAEVIGKPTYHGWPGAQPTSDEPTRTDQPQWEGTSFTLDPGNLQSAGQVTIDWWDSGVADSDAAEVAKLSAVIASTVAGFAGLKKRPGVINRDAPDGGIIVLNFALTSTDEDVVNQNSSTTLDPNRIESTATTAAFNVAPPAATGDAAFVQQTETINELNDSMVLHRGQFGLLDSKEKVEFPGTATQDDPYDLADSATLTQVHNTATPPADPSAPAGQLVERETVRINRVRWRTVWTYRNLNSEQAIEFPEATIETDPSGLKSADRQSTVNGSSTPPSTPATRVSGLVLRVIRSRRVGGTPEKWLHVWEFGETSTEEDVTFPGTITDDEVSNLADKATITVVTGSSAAPSTPAAPLGQILRVESEQLTDSGKWRHTFTYGNTTEGQALEFRANNYADDPQDLIDTDTQSVLGTSSAPSDPSPRLIGLKLRRRSGQRVSGTPEQWLWTWEFGRRDTKDDVEMPETVTGDDPYDLDDQATITKVTSSGTPPSTPAAPVGELIEIRTEQIHDTAWKHTFKYANLNSHQRIEFPENFYREDPAGLEDFDRQAVVDTNLAPPVDPSPRISGLVLRVRTTRRVGGTPAMYLHVWEFGRRSTEQDVTFPGTVTSDEVSDIADDATITQVTASSTPPSTPAAPVGTLLKTRSEQLTDSGKWKHTFEYGNTTALQHIQFPTDVQDGDPSLLQDEDHQSQTTGTSTPPVTPASRIAGLVLRETSSMRIAGTPEKWLHRWTFGRRTTEQDVTFPGTVTSNEVSDIADDATITLVTASSTPPTTPSAPLGQLLETRSEQMTDAGKWKHTFHFGNTTALQHIQFPTDVVETDPSDLRDEDHQSETTSSSTVPTTPATRVAGLVLRTVTSKRISGTPEKWLHQWFFGRTTTAEDITFPGSVKADDVGDLEDRATVTVITAFSTPPAVPSAPLGQYVETRSEQLTDSGQWKHTFTYENTTSVQKAQFPNDKPSDDPQNLEDADVQALVTTSLTPPTTPTARPSSLKLREISSQRIGGTPAQYLHVWRFGRRNTQEDIEFPATVKDADQYSIDGDATIRKVTASSTPPATPAAPLGECVSIQTVQIHAGSDGEKWQHTFKYAQINSQQRLTFPENVAAADPSALKDVETQAVIDNSATPPVDPSPAISGLVLRSRRTRQVSGTPAFYLHIWEFGRKSTQEEIEFPGTITSNETSDIDDRATITQVTSSSTPPSAPAAPVGQFIAVESEQLTDAGKWRHTFTYGNTTALQKIQFPTDVVTSDPSLLEDEDQQSDVNGSSTPPATPAARISGLVLRWTRSERIAGTPEKWLHRWRFGRRTTAEDITYPGSVTTDEVSDIADDATVTQINASSTPPATPAAPVGTLLEVRSERLTDAGKWKHTFRFGNTTALQRIQFPTDTLETDPSELKDEDRQSQTTGTSTVPATPATRILGCVLRTVLSRRISGTPEKWLHQWTFGRRSSQQDVEFPGTVTTDEISDIADEATVTLVTVSATAPSTPTAPVGQLLEVTSEQLTDAGKWRHTFRFGNTTALQKLQFPTDVVETDPGALADEDQQSDVNGSSTPPSTPATRVSGLVLRSINSVRIAGEPEKWLHKWRFGRRSTTEDVTFPGTVTSNEVSDLRDKATITQVTASSTPPSDPGAPVGQLIAIESEQLTDAGKWRHTFHYANTTAIQEIAFGETETGVDPQGIEGQDKITLTNLSSTPPATPTPSPATLKLRRRASQRIGGTPEQWRHTFIFGVRNTVDDIQMPGTVTDNDPYDLADQATITLETASGTPPTVPAAPVGQHVETETVQIHDTAWKHTFRYQNLNSLQKIEFPENILRRDPAGLQDFEQQADVTTSSTPPTDPSPQISGLVIRVKRSRRVGGTPEKWLHVWEFGRRTTQQDVEMPGTVKSDDVSDLADHATITLVTPASFPPSTPAAPLGVFVSVDSEQLTDSGRWKHTFTYRNVTNQQRVEFEGTTTEDDPSDLRDECQETDVTSSSTPPATPTPAVSGLKLRRRMSQRLSGTPEKWKHTFFFARRTTLDDVQMDGTFTRFDSANLEDNGAITIVNASSDGLESDAYEASFPDAKYVSQETRQLHDGKWAHTLKFGPRTTQDDVEMPATITQDDPQDLVDEATITVVTSSGTPPSTPAAPVGTKLRMTRTRQLKDTKWAHTFEYRRRNAADEVTMEGSSVTDDAADLADAQITVVVTSSGTPSDPGAPSGLKLRETITRQLHDTRWRHEFRYARTNRADDITFAETVTILDSQAIESGGTIAVINTSSTPPSDPGAPATDTKLISTHTKQLQGATPKYVHIFHYGPRTTQQDIEWMQSRAVIETGQLDRRPIVVEVTSSSTPDASADNPDGTNLSYYSSTTHRITDSKYVHVHEFRPLTSTEEAQEREAEVVDDPVTLLDGKERRCIVDTNATTAAPTVSGKVCIKRVTQRIGKLQYRHTFTFDFRSVGDSLEADKTVTSTDLSALDSKAVTADVWLVGSEPVAPTLTGYQLVEKTDFEIQNPLYRLRVYRWGLVTNQQKIEFQHTIAADSPTDKFKRRTASIITVLDSDTAAALADSVMGSNISDSLFDGVEIRKLTPTRALQIIETAGDDKSLTASQPHTFEDSVVGRPSDATWGTGASYGVGTAFVHVVRLPGQIVGGPGGFTEGLVAPTKIWRHRQSVRYRRRIVTDSAGLATYFRASLIGLTNNNAMLGRAAHFLMFQPPTIHYCLNISGAHLLLIDYNLEYDSQMWMGDTYMSDGWLTCRSGVLLGGTGYVQADTTFDANMVLNWPPQGDLSVIL